MGLSSRILLRICLPAAALVVGLGLTHHYATRDQHVAAAEARLQQAATTVSEMIAYRCEGVAQQLDDLLADEDEKATLGALVGGETIRAHLARETVADEMRLALDQDARLVRLDLYTAAGAGILGVARGEATDVPVPAGDRGWFQKTLADNRFQSWPNGPGEEHLTRISVSLTGSGPGGLLVLAALVDFDRIAQPAVRSGTQGLASVSARIECAAGRIRYGSTVFAAPDTVLRSHAPVSCFDGRVQLEQPRDEVLAGLLSFERDALIVSLVLITCVAALLWTGMRALVLTPLRNMLGTVAAFEAGEAIPAPVRRGRPSGELAVLDGALRKAFQASVDNRRRLQELNNSLEGRVRARTAELEHNANALRIARDEAARANEAKGSFVANVSHEVRTPLNAIIGMTGMLAETELDKEQADCVETVRQAGENLLTLINQILDFSKVEAGRLELEHIEFDLRETVRGVSSLLGQTARQKGLVLEDVISDGCPTRLRGDPTRLRQVLVNLVGNALKFTRSGRVRVTASLERGGALWNDGEREGGSLPAPRPDGGPLSALRFEVQDTGIGISEAAQKKLFEPFSQAEQSTTRHYGGTGLGLAICKQIVERMGGRIGVQSRDGHGSTFWFVIPFETRAGHELVGAAPAAQRWELAGLRVLVASSQPGSRRSVEEMLAACGTRCDTAATVEAALEVAAEAFATGRAFHAALLDENLADDGAEGLARALRSDPALARMPLLLMTREDDREAARRMGFDLTLTKPVNALHLIDALCALVTGAPPATRAPGPRPSSASSASSARVDSHAPSGPDVGDEPPMPAAEAHVAPGPTSEPASDATSEPRSDAVPDAVPEAVPEADADARPSPPAPAGPTEADARPVRGTLLLAEDNTVNQRVATRALEKLGFRVQVVGDGAAAVQAALAGGFDAVLMDLQMPVMDGYEAVRRIRAAEPPGRRLPIVALTAHAMAGDRERALADGLDDYVCKPVRPADLAAVLDRWLGGSALPAPGAPPTEVR